MKSVVIYASRSGNTRTIAEAIGDTLRAKGTAELLPIDGAPDTFAPGTDLVLIGGPTEGHRMTGPVGRYFDRIGPRALDGISAAAFDTRLHWPRWLSGSAAADITLRLHGAGAHVIAPGESFIVTREPALEPGEVKHARRWAASLAAIVGGQVAAVAG